jgi:hypothetical protein
VPDAISPHVGPEDGTTIAAHAWKWSLIRGVANDKPSRTQRSIPVRKERSLHDRTFDRIHHSFVAYPHSMVKTTSKFPPPRNSSGLGSNEPHGLYRTVSTDSNRTFTSGGVLGLSGSLCAAKIMSVECDMKQQAFQHNASLADFTSCAHGRRLISVVQTTGIIRIRASQVMVQYLSY